MSNVKKEDKKLVGFVETTADPMSENKEATEHVESASQILDEGCRYEQARSMVHGEVVDSDLSAGPSIEHEETEPDLSSEQQSSVASELPSAAFGSVTTPRSPFSPSYYPYSPPYSPGSPRHSPSPPAYGSTSPNFSQPSPPYSPSSPPYYAPGSSSSLSSSPQYGGGNFQSLQLIVRGSPTS